MTIYTGMRMPNGEIPRPHPSREGAQKTQTFLTNQDSKMMYMWRLLDIAMSVFKWEGLPKGVDERMMEYWLLRDGFVGFFHDDDLKKDPFARAPEGYAVLPLMIKGKWDNYQYPTERTAYATNGNNYELTEDNSVIVFNDYIRVPTWFTLDMYAERLANCDRTIDVNLAAQKTPKIIRCPEKKRLTMLNFAKEVDENKPWIYGDPSLDPDLVSVLDTSAPFVALDIQTLKHQYWNEVLTFLGIENVNTEKKERLVTDEVMNNMGDVEAQRFVRLNARKQAAERINELFGLDVKVEFRTGIYIKADGYAARNLPTTGMTDGSAPSTDMLRGE